MPSIRRLILPAVCAPFPSLQPRGQQSPEHAGPTPGAEVPEGISRQAGPESRLVHRAEQNTALPPHILSRSWVQGKDCPALRRHSLSQA